MKYFLTLALILTGFGASAASWYVRDGASGSGTSWTDAYDQLSSAETAAARGDTIYVADGSYGGVTFNTAASGSTLITVKKATIAAHGTETGWSDAYGDGQASFTGGFDITTSYWVIDGVNGSLSRTVGDYGFTFTTAVTECIGVYNLSINITDITLSHIGAIAPAGDVQKIFFATDNSTKNITNVTLSHCLISGYENCQWATGPSGTIHTGWITEHNMILNVWSSATFHGEDINNNFGDCRNWTIRWNWFEGVGNEQPTMIIGALNGDAGPYYIYGNVFKDKTFSDGGICAVNNGYGSHTLSGSVYNNTFINCESEYGGVKLVGGAGNNTMDVKNNLVVDSYAAYDVSGAVQSNAYYNVTGYSAETGGLVLNVNPFVNQGATNFHWAYATNKGATLGSPYNVDFDGVTRGADGNWDRGAFEYTSGTTNPPLITVVNLIGTNGVAIPTYTITTTGGTPLTYGASNLPSGLSLSGANITGTPLSASGQTNTVLLSATNWGGYALTNVTFSIGQTSAPTATLAATLGFNAAAADNYPALRALETYASTNGSVSLTLTNGTYTCLFPVSGDGTYRGLQRGACEFTGLTNITISGPGSEFYSTNIVNSEQSFFRFVACTNIDVRLKFKGAQAGAGTGLKGIHLVRSNDTAVLNLVTLKMYDAVRAVEDAVVGKNRNLTVTATNVDTYYGTVFGLSHNITVTNYSIGTASNSFGAHRGVYVSGCSNVTAWSYTKDMNVPDGVNLVTTGPASAAPYHWGSTNVTIHAVDLGSTNYVQYQSIGKIGVVTSSHQDTNMVHQGITLDVTAPSTATVRTNNYALAIGCIGTGSQIYTNITFSGTFQHGASNTQDTIYFENSETGLARINLRLVNFYDTNTAGIYTLLVNNANPIVVVTATNSTVNSFYFVAPANPQTFTDLGDYTPTPPTPGRVTNLRVSTIKFQ